MKSFLFLSGILGLITGCATSPEGRGQLILVSESQMEQMGAQGFDEVKKKMTIENDPALNRYVQCVAKSILAAADPGGQWEIVVFREPSANAFALPGRKIGVHTGLFQAAKTQGQLATVLGHEVGHVLARHGAERVSHALVTQGGLAIADRIIGARATGQNKLLMAALGLGVQMGVALPHSRKQESEADVIGLRLMARAGYQPQESIELWQNMAAGAGRTPPEWLSTHPGPDTRIQNLQRLIPEVTPLYRQAPSAPRCEGLKGA